MDFRVRCTNLTVLFHLHLVNTYMIIEPMNVASAIITKSKDVSETGYDNSIK